MIELKNITKSFDEKTVLDNVNGKFHGSSINMIIGASGCGKSVLTKCMVGLIQPDQGNVYFSERNFTTAKQSTQVEIRREIGMLFQGGALFDSKNVEENVRFPLDMLTQMSKDEKLERVNFCLQCVGLENANKKLPAELSGGMKKRVGIARAIVNTPNYLFCDEPNSGLDPQTALRIDELIKKITYEQNITTVIVTHDMNSVVGIGDYVLFLYQTKKAWEGTVKAIFSAKVKALDDFVFAGKMTRMMKNKVTT